jgi:hypothetical protein
LQQVEEGLKVEGLNVEAQFALSQLYPVGEELVLTLDFVGELAKI